MATGLLGTYEDRLRAGTAQPLPYGPLATRKRTFGGAYGNPGGTGEPTLPNPMARPGYAPMRSQGLMAAPQDAAGYQQAMTAQNPGGRFYGGLLPSQITSPSGQVRSGFVAAPAQAGGNGWSLNDTARWAGKNGMYWNNATGVMSGNPDAANLSETAIRQWQATGHKPGTGLSVADAAKGRPAYEQAYAQRQAAQRQQTLGRVAIRDKAKQEREQMMLAQQQQQQMGLLMRINPELAMRAMALQQQGLLANAQLGLDQQRLAQQGTLGQQQSQDRRYVADQQVAAAQHRAWGDRYSQAIKDGNSPDDAMKLAGPPPAGPSNPAAPQAQGGLLGPPAAPQQTARGGFRPKKQLLDSQIAAIAGAAPEQRESMLRAMGVTSPQDIAHYQSQIDPDYNTPGFWQRLTNAAPNIPFLRWGAAAGDAVSPYLGPLLFPQQQQLRARYRQPPPPQPTTGLLPRGEVL